MTPQPDEPTAPTPDELAAAMPPGALSEGVTQGWVYLWNGPGPAKARPSVVMVDGEGAAAVEPTGGWHDVTVVDDALRIAKFLLARFTEDEQAALGAGGKAWRTDRVADETPAVVDSDGWGMVYRESSALPEVPVHIVRHDPARVLGECAAKRRIVELHEPQDHPAHAGYGARRFCGVCGGDNAYESPCDTLRALASVYSDHEDFDQAWRV